MATDIIPNQPTLAQFTGGSIHQYGKQVALRLLRKKGQWERKGIISKYFENNPVPKLHVGAGPNYLKGWLNTDLRPKLGDMIFLDATEDYPFPSGAFRYIFSEHLIEHLSYNYGQKMLRECYRVLQPGGTIRIATPNLLNLLALFADSRTSVADKYIEWARHYNGLPATGSPECFVLNNFMRNWGHTFLYDPPTLKAALECTGFGDVTFQSPGKSDDQVLHGAEHHGSVIGDENNLFETLVVEAKR